MRLAVSGFVAERKLISRAKNVYLIQNKIYLTRATGRHKIIDRKPMEVNTNGY